MSRLRRVVAIAFAVALAFIATFAFAARSARADDGAQGPGGPGGDPTETLFRSGLDALSSGRPADAISDFEALGDHGVVDPVVSFDRGLAYALRVRAGGETSGDLGRAVHGFEEARALTHDARLKEASEHALTELRAELARRRAHAGESMELDDGASLGRSLVRLLPENVWALLALAASLALAFGIVLRAKATSPRAKVAGGTTCAVAAVVSLAAAIAVIAARNERRTLREGIVVVDGTRPLDARHVVRNEAQPIPEGTRVRLLDDGGEFTEIAAGNTTGYVPSTNVLPLAKP